MFNPGTGLSDNSYIILIEKIVVFMHGTGQAVFYGDHAKVRVAFFQQIVDFTEALHPYQAARRSEPVYRCEMTEASRHPLIGNNFRCFHTFLFLIGSQ